MASIAARLKKFLASPLNKAGLLAWGATALETGLSQYLSHTVSVPILATGAVGGLVAVLLPDNTAAKTDAEQLAKDGIAAWVTKNPAELPALLADAAKVAGDLAPTSTAKAS